MSTLDGFPNPSAYRGVGSLSGLLRSRFGKERVLVFGGSGFVGKYVVSLALELDWDVWAVGRSLPAERGPLQRKGLTMLSGDLRKKVLVGALIDEVQPSIVVNLARSGFARGRHPFDEMWRTNVMGVINLLEGMVAMRSVRFVHVGSSTEYRPSPFALSEADTTEPVGDFGRTKLAAYWVVRSWAEGFQIPSAVVRPFKIYGLGEPEMRLVPTLLRAARTMQPVALVDSETRRDYVHAWDVASGILRAACIASNKVPVINLGRGVSHSPQEVAEVVAEVTGISLEIDPSSVEPEPIDSVEWVSDNQTAGRILSWTPEISLEEGVRITWNQLRGL